ATPGTSTHTIVDAASYAVRSNARPISGEWAQDGSNLPGATAVRPASPPPIHEVARVASCQSAHQSPSWDVQSMHWEHAGTTLGAAPIWFGLREACISSVNARRI